MKAKIEIAANVTVIVLAIVVGSVFLRDRFFSAGSEITEIRAGDKLTSLNGWDWAAHDRTLVLGLKKGCHFCEESVPFYQRLVAQQRSETSKLAILAIFPDSADAVKEIVQSEGLEVQALGGVAFETLKISGTPTLLLVDKNGTVLRAWSGMLSPRQEAEVMGAAKEAANMSNPST